MNMINYTVVVILLAFIWLVFIIALVGFVFVTFCITIGILQLANFAYYKIWYLVTKDEKCKKLYKRDILFAAIDKFCDLCIKLGV